MKKILIIAGLMLFTSALLYIWKFSYVRGVFHKEQRLKVAYEQKKIIMDEKSQGQNQEIILAHNPSQAQVSSESPAEKKFNTEIGALLKDLKSEDWAAIQEASNKLFDLGKAAVPELLRALPDNNIAFKGRVIFILGKIGDSEAVPGLIEALRDENGYIRSNAADALGKIKDQRAIHSLRTALFDDDSVVRERAAWALGELKEPAASEYLMGRLTDETEEGVKMMVVNALAKLKDTRATPVLLNELKSKNDQVYKNEVVIALSEIADSKALEGLTAFLFELKQFKPADEMRALQQKEAIKITENAIAKIQGWRYENN